MADKKISSMTLVGTPLLSGELALAQSGASYKMTLSQTKDIVLSGGVTSGPITMVTNLLKSGTNLLKKSRTMTITSGVITDVGDETDWVDVGSF